jgi:hypothetical protein
MSCHVMLSVLLIEDITRELYSSVWCGVPVMGVRADRLRPDSRGSACWCSWNPGVCAVQGELKGERGVKKGVNSSDKSVFE